MDKKKVAEKLKRIAKEIRAKEDFDETTFLVKLNSTFLDLNGMANIAKKNKVSREVASGLTNALTEVVKLIQHLKRVQKKGKK